MIVDSGRQPPLGTKADQPHLGRGFCPRGLQSARETRQTWKRGALFGESGHQFLEALVISKRRVSPFSGKPVGDSTETQCYLAIRIMVEEELVFSYIKHWKMTLLP